MTWYSRFGSKLIGKTAPQTLEDEDFMEQGLALSSKCLLLREPWAEGEERRLVVHKSQDENICTLANKEGELLLAAMSTADGSRFLIFTVPPGQVLADGASCEAFMAQLASSPPEPSFALVSASSRDDWQLLSLRCERCQLRGRRTCGEAKIATMYHYTEKVGNGNAYCMDVTLPEVPDDGFGVGACERCGTTADPDYWDLGLSSVRPKWSVKRASLALDFRGRATMASAKNFQLARPDATEREQQKPLLLFGKVAEKQFVLDFRAPLGALQAFAIALTASHWK